MKAVNCDRIRRYNATAKRTVQKDALKNSTHKSAWSSKKCSINHRKVGRREK